jgi:WD40 repeat protein
LWDAADGSLLKTLAEHTDHVRVIAFLPNRRELLSAGLDFTVRLYDPARDESRVLMRTQEAILSLAVSPDGTTLAAGTATGVIRTWDLPRNIPLNTFSADTDATMSLAFAPDGMTLVAGSRGGTVRLWDPVAAQLMLSFDHPASCNAVAISLDGRHLAAGFHDSLIRVWTVGSSRPPMQ